VQAGVEECDDGNMDDIDGCVGMCINATCGDGFVQEGVEDCDDANMEDTDDCVGMCTAASCGDGFVQMGVENCDDGNMVDTDMCTTACNAAACGDGFVQGMEQCDDGNMVANDGCSPMCMTEVMNPLTVCTMPNSAIPDFGAGTPSAINIAQVGTVTDVNVRIVAAHTWPGDLVWTLSKGNTSRVLINRVTNGGGGCSTDNMDVMLDDENNMGAVQALCNPQPPALSGTRAPNLALSIFDNQAMAGAWTLSVNDGASGDMGTFQQWCITIAYQ
jgi:cysteine-rich repeat protein